MTRTKRWSVEIFIDEHDDHTTRAEARLHTTTATTVTGVGVARKNPDDLDVPEIGDELATARALSDLGERLLRTAAEDIEALTHEPVHVKQ